MPTLFQIFLLTAGAFLAFGGLLVVFSSRFNDWMNRNLWKNPSQESNSKNESNFNRYVRGTSALFIGLALLFAFWTSFY